MRKKKNLWGVVMAAGVGVLTYMIYGIGKLEGKGEAYGDCANMLQEVFDGTQITCEVSKEEES